MSSPFPTARGTRPEEGTGGGLASSCQLAFPQQKACPRLLANLALILAIPFSAEDTGDVSRVAGRHTRLWIDLNPGLYDRYQVECRGGFPIFGERGGAVLPRSRKNYIY